VRWLPGCENVSPEAEERPLLDDVTARVFRSDSPGKAAQWLARFIRESCGML
jgi:hypothetical protein